VDGEHYPPVVEAALKDLVTSGHDVAAAVLVGGKEKLPADGLDAFGDVRVVTGDDPPAVLARAIEDEAPDEVLDLSDEPVLDYRRRHLLVSVALRLGVPYSGADFAFTPPPRPQLVRTPSIAINGTGKRTGKTAVAGFAARALVQAGASPCIIAMGRGGPPEPQLLRGDEIELEPPDLLELAEQGKHAASDYVEDALLGRVPTVGCRRCGGGLAGAVWTSNVADGVEMANELDTDLTILEGSGSAIPPVHSDAAALVVPANIPLEYLRGYLGPYRLLLSDLVVITMCEEPFGSPSHISAVVSEIRDAFQLADAEGEPHDIRVVRTVFRPSPTRSVEGAKVFVATTAPPEAGDSITAHLEEHDGCEIVGISHSLSDRKKLTEEIADMSDVADLLLCEVKAAGIDVATKKAIDEGLDVVYMDNVPKGVDGDDPVEAIGWLAGMARDRFNERSNKD
jgi:cyclic 2,3-diphosphoglycerate synthetase